MAKQCKIYNKESGLTHGAILLDSGDVICGCCGGLIESDEIGDKDDCSHRILKIYSNWVDLSDSILD